MLKGFRVYFFRRDPKSIYHKEWECSVFVPVETREEAITAAYEKMKDGYPKRLYSAKCYPTTVVV